MEVKRKYGVLGSIAGFLRFVAYLNILASVCLGIIVMQSLGSSGVTVIVLWLAGCFVTFIITLAFSEVIKVFIDIEKNTQKIVAVLNYEKEGMVG